MVTVPGPATAKRLRTDRRVGSWEGGARTEATIPGLAQVLWDGSQGPGQHRQGRSAECTCSWGPAGQRGQEPDLCGDWLAIQTEMAKRDK